MITIDIQVCAESLSNPFLAVAFDGREALEMVAGKTATYAADSVFKMFPEAELTEAALGYLHEELLSL